jgi:predicted unusual protein kinase regulating ubiquinone biosynthesis (AarF/ABC1/UbiB family)
MDWLMIEKQLVTSLGDSYSELEIDPDPLAAASLAQVHRATTVADQQALCLKVQYPGVANTIESDFKTVLQMLRFGRWLPNGKDLEAWIQEIKSMLLDEVDYQREAQMTQKIAELLAADQRYKVPQIWGQYSSTNLLCMSYEPGHSVTDPAIAVLSQHRRNELAEAMLDVFFKEVFVWGIMQTDPNFGNYRIQLRGSDEENDRLVLLDFGAVRSLEAEFSTALQKTIIAAHQNNRDAVIEGAIKIGCLQKHQANDVKQSFADFCILLMEPFRKDHSNTPSFALNAKGVYSWHESKLLKRVGKVGAKAVLREGFTSPPKEFALIARKLTGVFTFITALKAEFNADHIIDEYL